MEDLRQMVNGLKPVILMVMVQIAFAAVNVLYKLAINDGMSMRIATAYRLLFGSAFTVPLALVFERSDSSFFINSQHININYLTWSSLLILTWSKKVFLI